MTEKVTHPYNRNSIRFLKALELMFKEAEEKRLTTGDVSGMRRRRRLPQR